MNSVTDILLGIAGAFGLLVLVLAIFGYGPRDDEQDDDT